MRMLSLAGLVLAVALPGGCELRSARTVQADADRRQQVADSAASIYEAAAAIEQGAPVMAPSAAIKRQASAIADAQGIPYPSTPSESLP